ncbi:MAG: WGR domain-containing protein [Chloroflexota bacterium]|nr:WGR domain-containing protein [Chloroflexota bacterium]
MSPPDPPAIADVARFRCRVRFVSLDPAKNRARFYTLTWQPALWGGGAVVRSWGRVGGSGRALTAFYPDRASAQASVERLIRRRLRRGYRVVEWW